MKDLHVLQSCICSETEATIETYEESEQNSMEINEKDAILWMSEIATALFTSINQGMWPKKT